MFIQPSPSPLTQSLGNSKEKENSVKTSSLSYMIFTFLDFTTWKQLPFINKSYKNLCFNPLVVSHLTKTAPISKRLNLSKKAGLTLKELNLSTSTVTNKQLLPLAKSCPNIQSLNLSSCKKLTRFLIIPQIFQKLEYLNLEDTRICKETADTIKKRYPSLRLFYFSWQDLMRDAAPLQYSSLLQNILIK